jgi:Na+/H+-dicarboxylate symporter
LLTGPSAATVFVSLAAGFLCGAAAFAWPASPLAAAIPVLEPAGAVWLAALQMLALPLMTSMMIVSIGRAGTGQAGRLGAWTLLWVVAFLAVAAAATVLSGQLVLAWFPLEEASRIALQVHGAGAAALDAVQSSPPTARDWFANLVPANLIRAAAAGDYLSLIVAALLFGAALRFVPDPGRERLLDLIHAVSVWCLALAGLLLRLLPLAVFVLTLASTARSGLGTVSALAYYVFWLSVFLVAATLILYPCAAVFGRVPIGRFARALGPVQALALSTRSSVACLPAMLDAARRRLGLPEDVAGFTLTFAVSAFKLNMGISANFQLLFLLHAYGLQPDPAALGVAVIALTAQSFATPGLPSGAIWTTTPVYLGMGIPIEGVVLTNAVDTIPDLFKTVANVTGDMSIAAIVAQRWRPGSASG